MDDIPRFRRPAISTLDDSNPLSELKRATLVALKAAMPNSHGTKALNNMFKYSYGKNWLSGPQPQNLLFS